MTTESVRQETAQKVDAFAASGLRTLVYAQREVDPKQYSMWVEEHKSAQCLIGAKRQKAIELIASKVETNLKTMGVTGVEDKLQPGVRKCLRSLTAAGIQVPLIILCHRYRYELDVCVLNPVFSLLRPGC